MWIENYKSLAVAVDSALVEAVKVLEKEAQFGLVTVVGPGERLEGTVTDGDVRRALISGVSMLTPVVEVMNRSPVTVRKDVGVSKLRALCIEHGIVGIPLVEGDGRLAGIFFDAEVDQRRELDAPVVVMAGGFGKRLAPITNSIPKPLVKVGEKPILERLVEQIADAGFRKIYITTHYKAEMIEDYFGDGSSWDVNIGYVREEKPLGTAGALGLLKKELVRGPSIVMNCDLLTRVNLNALLEFHQQSDAVATMCVRQYDFQIPYGVVAVSGSELSSIIEKPVRSEFVNAGIYVVTPRFIRNIPTNTASNMPALIEDVSQRSEKVAVFPIHEYWRDIGLTSELASAKRELENNFDDWQG